MSGDCGVYYACAVLGVLGRNFAEENISWETPVILVLLFPKVLKNAHCTRLKNLHIRVYER